MTNLISTYRIQFHKEFSFEDFEKIIPYLRKLGVGTIYASPVFRAVPGSNHGYDGLDPQMINPEIGNYEQFVSISDQLRAADISWLQDIVPNHMAFDPRNEWLKDVLEKGPQSRFAPFFDTAWTDPFFEGRLMVPFLGKSAEEAIDDGDLKLDYDGDRFVFRYFEAAYPLQPLSYETILASGKKMPATVKQLISQIPKSENKEAYNQAWDEWRMQLASAFRNDKVKAYVQNSIESINIDKEKLRTIESKQSYRLCSWQETDQQINYRRFFTVNGLICLNIQDDEVFKSYHRLVQQMLDANLVQGLRIDHVDGLYDPAQYLERLRQLAGDQVPVLVEKILEPGESLPENWPVQGNTGYDFLSLVNNLLTSQDNEKNFSRFYRRLVHDNRPVHEQVVEKKSLILHRHMAGELENLYRLFRQLNLVDKRSLASIRPEEIRDVIGEFLVHIPVYRFYGNSFPLGDQESEQVRNVLNHVRKYNPDLNRAVDVFENVLLQRAHDASEEYNSRLAHFYKRCMQFSGPLMAKGVEDTLMYTYHRFIGHNEVGDSPDAFGMSTEAFHEAMIQRQNLWPYTLNATSTHDTKRGEDARARLNVLTDMGEEWIESVSRWMESAHHDQLTENDRYFIFQSIVGAYPFPGSDHGDFPERLQDYLEKALREAKTSSNWTTPNESYEKAAKEFAAGLLNQENEFMNQLNDLLSRICDHGIINSLTQTMLKFTCPGIPDVYQGSELWDLSFVDPDNRRSVDYLERISMLGSMEESSDFNELWTSRFTGNIKLWLTFRLYQLRQQLPYLFTTGEYIPLKVEGTYKDHVLAFARKYRKNILVIAVPLHTYAICREQDVELHEVDWKDTSIQLPEVAVEEWQLVLTSGKEKYSHKAGLAQLFAELPFAILGAREISSERGAGILLHISSLPSPFGIGDVGPEARSFASFLQKSAQKYWQLLPLNPTEEGQGHSPYSSISSRAGNVLFISPELLVKQGLLKHEDLQNCFVEQDGRTHFGEAEEVKSWLFEKAWQAFRVQEAHPLHKEFGAFREKEKEWLEDFALYVLLKQEHGGKPWFEWEKAYKFHDEAALAELHQANAEVIEKIKWLQFVFAGQWHELKQHCNRLGIQLIGDLPFYVSYDSADVWAHRHLFALDEEGKSTGVAGVPPDAFSSDGQLWGMPVFNWEAHRQENYSWWISRLKKNIELFDLVRLDHFRAFSAYWKVPAGEQTARNGTWEKGPGEEFFSVIQEALGALPFVAEDLGDIDEDVYRLRDSFHLPGMKVLQFAFGNDMHKSVHIPHNYQQNFIVYTGTHDNNTTRGWFNSDAGDEARLALERYTGRPISSAEVSFVMARMAYGSVAQTVILPMQDVLNLDEQARMNIPASASDNWGWRLLPGQISEVAGNHLRNWTRMYNRE